jgi:hypothetical protein
MRNITAEQAGTEIRRAYDTWTAQGNSGWMRTVEIFNRADLSIAEAAAGISHLNRAGGTFCASDDPARLEWTAEIEAAQIPVGPELIGLIVW